MRRERRQRIAGGGIVVVIVALVAITACDKNSEESTAGDSTQRDTATPTAAPQAESADTGSEPPPRELFGTRHEQAEKVMDRLVEAVESHFASASKPEEATFPGGTGVDWTSRETPPEKGATYRFAGDVGTGRDAGDGSADTSSRDPIAEALGLEAGIELPGQIVYRTGEGTGHEATATIRVLADFDPSFEADHTLVQELDVDPKTGDVNIFPRLTRHRWK